MGQFETNRRADDSDKEEGPDDANDLFAVVAEFSNQSPILMETEGPFTSYGAAQETLRRVSASKSFLRACVVRLVYVGGNSLVLHDMKRLQK